MKIEFDGENVLDACPSREQLCMLAADPEGDGLADIAAHVFVCGRCRKAFEEVLYPREESSITDEDRRIISAFVRSRCREYLPYRQLKAWVLMHPPVPRLVETPTDGDSYFRRAAAKDSKRPKSADSETILLTYASFGGIASGTSWRAFLSLPANPSDKTKMSLAVEGMDGRPAEGVFVVAGVRTALSCGRGEIAYPDFVAGLHDSNVFLECPDGRSTSGTLVLF